MGNMKLSLCLALTIISLMVTLSTANGEVGKIRFQDSSELGESDPGNVQGHGHGHAHRGRGRGHQHKHDSMIKFEEGLPDLYPIKGPAQPPLILPSHPGRGVGLQKHQNNAPITNNNLPPVQGTPPQPKSYEGNPFLSKYQTSSVTPTNKQNPSTFPGVTNQLPTSDKPITTTPTNPRLTDLLYGSNLLEEEANRKVKVNDTTTDVNFGDRGLFDTAPHCKQGEILVNNRCRTAV